MLKNEYYYWAQYSIRVNMSCAALKRLYIKGVYWNLNLKINNKNYFFVFKRCSALTFKIISSIPQDNLRQFIEPQAIIFIHGSWMETQKHIIILGKVCFNDLL